MLIQSRSTEIFSLPPSDNISNSKSKLKRVFILSKLVLSIPPVRTRSTEEVISIGMSLLSAITNISVFITPLNLTVFISFITFFEDSKTCCGVSSV